MTRNGTAYRLQPLAPLTGGIASGSLPTPTTKHNMVSPSMQKWAAHRNVWATPKATDAERGGRGDLIQQVRGNQSPSGHFRWPTPTTSDTNGPGRHGTGGLDLRTAVSEAHPTGGSLNPTFVEFLMGFPKNWTEVE